MQLCDESAMIIATFIVFYQLLCFSQTRFSPTQLLVGLSAAAMVVVIAQYVTGESTVQQIVFTTMVYWLWHTCFKMIGKIQGNNGVKNGMWWMAVSGIGELTYCYNSFYHRADVSRLLRHRSRLLGHRLQGL